MNKAVVAGIGIAVLAAAGTGGYLHLQKRADTLLGEHLARIDAILPAGYTLTHAGVEADPFGTGGTLRDVVLAGDGEVVTVKEVRLARVGATHADRVELDTIRATSGTLVFTSDTMTIEDLDLSVAAAAVAKAGMQAGIPLDRVRFGRLTAANLSAKDEDEDMEAGRVVLAGFGPGVLSRVEVERLGFRDATPSGDDPDAFAAGTVVVDGYDVATALGALLRDEEPPSPVGLKEVSAGKIAFTRTGTTLVSVDRVEANWSVADKANRSARLAVQGVDVPVTEEMIQGNRRFFEETGYERLGGDLDVAIAYDADKGTARIGPIALVARDMGAIAATVVLADAPDPLAVGEPDPDLWMRSKISGIELSYTDHSLLRRAMAAAAEQEGITEAELVEEGVRQIEALLSNGQALGRVHRESLAAVQSFLTSPGTIEVTAAPDQPVAVPALFMALMMAPSEVLDLLGVRVGVR